MSWTAIITALGLVIVSAYLVLIEGWSSWHALLYVGGGAIILIVSLIGVVALSAPEEERGQFFAAFWHGLREEWGATVRWIRGK